MDIKYLGTIHRSCSQAGPEYRTHGNIHNYLMNDPEYPYMQQSYLYEVFKENSPWNWQHGACQTLYCHYSTAPGVNGGINDAPDPCYIPPSEVHGLWGIGVEYYHESDDLNQQLTTFATSKSSLRRSSHA